MAGAWYLDFAPCSCGCGAAVVTAPDTRVYQLHTCHSPSISEPVTFHYEAAYSEPVTFHDEAADSYPAPLWLPEEIQS